MMTIIKSFLIRFGVDIDKDDEKNFVQKIGSLKSFIAGTAIAGAVTALGKAVNSQLESINELRLGAERVGATTESFVRFTKAAEMAGVESNRVISVFEKLNFAAVEAARGWGAGAESFAKVGISARKAGGEIKNAEELISEIGNRLKGKSETEQYTLMEYLGLNSKDSLVFMSEIQEAVSEYDKIAKAIPYDISKAADAAKVYEASFAKLRNTADALLSAFSAEVAPEISKVVNQIQMMVLDNAPLIIDFLAKLVNIVLTLSKFLSFTLTTVMKLIKISVEGLKLLNKLTDGWAGYITAAMVAWKVFGAAFKASPIGLLITTISAAILLLYEDFKTWSEGGKSFFDWSEAIKNWKAFYELMIYSYNEVTSTWDAFKTFFDVLLAFLAKKIISIQDWFIGIKDSAWENFQEIKKNVFSFYDSIIDKFRSIKDFVIKVFDEIKNNSVIDLAMKFASKVNSSLNDDSDSNIKDLVMKFASKVNSSFNDESDSNAIDMAMFAKGVHPLTDRSLSSQTNNHNNSNVHQNNNTTIQINGAGQPESVAEKIARMQQNVIDSASRNLGAAII